MKRKDKRYVSDYITGKTKSLKRYSRLFARVHKPLDFLELAEKKKPRS